MIFVGRLVMYCSPIPIDGEIEMEACVIAVEGNSIVRGGYAVASLEITTPTGRKHYERSVPVMPSRRAALLVDVIPVAYLLG